MNRSSLRRPLRWIRQHARYAGWLVSAAAAVVVLLTGVNVPAGFWTTENPWILVLVALWVGGSVFVGAARREGLEAGARVELRVMDVIRPPSSA